MAADTFGAENIMWIQQDIIKRQIAEHIKNQLTEDIASDQVFLKEYMDPFAGSKNIKG